MERDAPGLHYGPILEQEHLKKDRQTVSKEGRRLQDLIEGVRLRPAVTQMDERGTICEVFSAAWGFDEDPLVYVYQVSILPGVAKGWVLHLKQHDRFFAPFGRLRVVLFDGREHSPTYRSLNRFEVGELNRCLLRIPAGVYHVVQNIGPSEAYFYNLPTCPYNHSDPDKFRLPLDNEIIPYRVEGVSGR